MEPVTLNINSFGPVDHSGDNNYTIGGQWILKVNGPQKKLLARMFLQEYTFILIQTSTLYNKKKNYIENIEIDTAAEITFKKTSFWRFLILLYVFYQ